MQAEVRVGFLLGEAQAEVQVGFLAETIDAAIQEVLQVQVVGQDLQQGALQEALQWMDLPSASGGEGALVSVTLMFVDTGVDLLIGPLLGHTVMVTDIRDTEGHLDVTGVHLEEERHPDTEAEEVEAYLVVLCVTVLVVIAEVP